MSRVPLATDVPALRPDASPAADVAAERTARRRTEVLQRLTAALGAAHDVDDVARVALDDAAGALGYADGTFCLLDAAGEWFETVRKLGWPDPAAEPWHRFANRPGIPAHDAVASCRPVILADGTSYAARYPRLDAYDRATGQCGHLVFPLLDGDPARPACRVMGILSFDLRAPRTVDDEEIRFLEALVAVTAQALRRVQLARTEREARAAAERDAARLARLAALSEALVPLRSVADVSRTVLAHAVAVAGAAGGSVVRLTADGTHFEMGELAGYDAPVRAAYGRLPVDAPIPARDAVREERPVYIASLAAYRAAGYGPPPPHVGGSPGAAWAALPLLVGDDAGRVRALGALVLTFDDEQAIGDEARPFLESLARISAQAIERAMLAEAEAQVHERIEQAGRFLERVTSVAPDVLYVHDVVERRNVWVNDTIRDVLGLDRTETARRGADLMPSLLHPDEAPLIEAHFARLATLRDGEVATLTYRMRHADGSWRWLESREMVFRRDEDGRTRQVIGAATDITRRREEEGEQARIEAAYRASEARFRAMQDASPDGVLLLGAVRADDGRIVDFAYRYANAVAVGQQAPGGPLTIGERLGERQPSFRGSALFAAYASVVESGRPYVDEVRYAGEWIDGTFRVTAVRTADDEIGVTFADVSAHVAALESARAANRAKGEFLATMSHELRTPLNAIQGHVHLLTMGIHGPVTEAQRGALDRVNRAQRHLLGIINDVLNYARLEAGRIEYVLDTVDLAAVVEEAATMVDTQVAARGLRLERPASRPPGDGAVTAWCDRDKLLQVLLNLLSNAIKFAAPTEAGREARITVRLRPAAPDADARWHVIEVEDTGIGIPADRLETIFEPFVQVRADLARPAEGTGLGLAISRDLVRGMGGELTVESVERRGSTFRLLVPLPPSG